MFTTTSHEKTNDVILCHLDTSHCQLYTYPVTLTIITDTLALVTSTLTLSLSCNIFTVTLTFSLSLWHFHCHSDTFTVTMTLSLLVGHFHCHSDTCQCKSDACHSHLDTILFVRLRACNHLAGVFHCLLDIVTVTLAFVTLSLTTDVLTCMFLIRN